MAGIYPSLEDMVVSQYQQAQINAQTIPTQPPPQQYPNYNNYGQERVSVGGINHSNNQQQQPILISGYPSLFDDYAGAHLEPPSNAYTHHQVTVIKPITTIANVPSNNQLVNQSSSSSMILTGPLTSISSGLAKANVNHGVREVVLCKDANGKVGMRFREVDKGIFVQFVAENSPAALAGLRFGDQILQIDGTNLVGMSNDKAMDLLSKCANPKRITIIVRDRPFERTITMHKDSRGMIGFTHLNNEITAIVKDSSAARNGLLINHRILEINGQNVIGLSNKEVKSVMDRSDQSVTLTIMPNELYEHMIKRMDFSLIKKLQDHSIPDV